MEITKDTDRIGRYDLKKILQENKIDTLEGFIYYVYPEDDYYHDDESEIMIRKRGFDKPKNTMLNRFNLLWVFPIFFVSIPIRYVLYGEYNINRNSKLGEIVTKLIGYF